MKGRGILLTAYLSILLQAQLLRQVLSKAVDFFGRVHLRQVVKLAQEASLQAKDLSVLYRVAREVGDGLQGLVHNLRRRSEIIELLWLPN